MHFTNLFSKMGGRIAEIKFPFFLQKIINESYVRMMKIDLSEFKNVGEYLSLQELFTRELIKKRVFSMNKNVLISPCDSMISQFGLLKEEKMMQIKGMEYSGRELLTDKIKEENFLRIINGNYINFYLSPKDYHHYHAPCDFYINKIIYVPGKLYSVRYSVLKKKKDLFIKNERVILECVTDKNRLLYLIFVGATVVGNILLKFEPTFKTNTRERKNRVIEYHEPKIIKKGDDMGCFKLGSTVVMILEKGFMRFKKGLKANMKVKFGGEIGERK